MNVAIADGSRRHVGIGLALPADVVIRIAQTLAREGRVARPRLGLRLREAADLGAAGAPMIEDVEPDSPAALAGARAGQRLAAANGAPVLAARDLARALEPLAPGAALTLDLLDGDRRVTVTTRGSPNLSRRRRRAGSPASASRAARRRRCATGWSWRKAPRASPASRPNCRPPPPA